MGGPYTEPSPTSISGTEIALVTVIVVIAVSVAALAISKRRKRKACSLFLWENGVFFRETNKRFAH